jgi:hypothetical protein
VGEVVQFPLPSERERDVQQYKLCLMFMGFFPDTESVPEGLCEFIMDTCTLHLEVGIHKGKFDARNEE